MTATNPSEVVREEEEETGTRRSMDPELRLMGNMLRQLEDLDESARTRVVAWLVSRFSSRHPAE